MVLRSGGFVVLCSCLLCDCLSHTHTSLPPTSHTNELKKCEKEADKISGCIETMHYDMGGVIIIEEAPYKNAQVEGIVKWYDENKKLVRETIFEKGKKEGIQKIYKNGKLKAEMPYRNGQLHGDMKFYTKNGKLLALLKVQNNKIVGEQCAETKILTNAELTYLDKISGKNDFIAYLSEICSP